MNLKFQLFTFLILSVFLLSYTNSQEFEDCSGTRNTEPLLNLTWSKQAQTTRGQKYYQESGTNYVTLVNITGSPYQMGVAYGQLLEKEIKNNFEDIIEYMEGIFAENFEKNENVPKFLIKYLAEMKMGVVEYLLELNYMVGKPYIPERFIQEMEGIAKGASISYDSIKRLNMFPELIKAACSIVGTWKDSTVDNKLFTLRALDWEPDAPVSKYPVITVYHSNEEGSYPFANIGYAGLIGSITAVGSQGVSIQEKVELVREGSIPSTYAGKPWTFVIRDLAQFSTTLEEMAETLQDTDRTCPIFMGIASAESDAFEIVSYTWEKVTFFNDQNFTVIYSDNHPQLDYVAYVDKKVQPSSNACIGNILSEYWGEITWETLYRDVCGYHQTGDGQICVSDVKNNVIYLSYAYPPEKIRAYDRAPMYIDLKPFYGISSQ